MVFQGFTKVQCQKAQEKESEGSKIRKKLLKGDSSRVFPKNASKSDMLKYRLCEKFVAYLLDNKITQVQLAKMLNVDASRVNKIIKYRIGFYKIDKLIELAERIKLDFDIKIT